MDKQNEARSDLTPTKDDKCKDKKAKPGKIFRKKPLKSVGNFMNRVFKSLGTFGHFSDSQDAEDDDGGFRNGTKCTLNASVAKTDAQVPWGARNTPSTSSSICTGREKLLFQYGDKTPGVLGLKNHGNTCFMNAVVQCLSNTDLLAEYLGLERYKLDLTRVNGMGSTGQSARKGEVTEQLAALVRALWTLEYTPQLSVDFKTIVSKYGAQFRGNAQHDALEFLLWLMDRVHEDVTLASHNNNNITAPAQICDGEKDLPDHCSVHPSKVQHSFVQEHFQAQYKSSLTCPHCLKQSNTFDPFLCISLPIPLCQTRSLCVVLVFSSKGQRYLRVALSVPLFGSVSCLRRMVADEGNLSPDQVILTEVYSSGFQRSFFDEEDLSSIAENDVIYAFQAPPLYIRGGSTRISGYHHSLPSSPYSSGSGGQRLTASGALSTEFLPQTVPLKILLLVCNAAGSGQQVVRFGPPFLMREDRSISWDQLQQSILSKLYYLMVNGAQAQNARVLFNIRVVGGSAFYSYLSPQDGRPLCHPAVERALKMCGSGGPPHVKLIVEWEHRIKDCLFGNIQEEVVKEADSVRAQQNQSHTCTLDQCFQLYTKEEQLAPDDAWKCPHCKQLQQGTVQMSLWTLPDILILHLKRFRQVGERRNKLTTLVHFPLSGLDMTPHVVPQHRQHPPKHPVHNQHHVTPGWKQGARRTPGSAPPEFLYDLYAVCNHHGGMHGGHYTAYCRNSVDGQWYSFDDSSVESVTEGEVCTRWAYLLFYQRRDSIPVWSASSSVSGSTSSSASDHWLIRLTGGSSERDSVGSGGALSGGPQGSTAAPESPELPVFGDEPYKSEDTNGFDTKPFVRGTNGRSVSMRSPTKSKDPLSRVLPLRWSLASKDRLKTRPQTPPPPPQPGELVEYLESGRRPRCTQEPIVSLVTTPPLRTAHGRMLQSGLNSLNSSNVSASMESPRIPEGERRTCIENALRCSKRLDHGRTLDFAFPKQVMLDNAFSQSAPASRDSTLRRTRIQNGVSNKMQKDLLHMVLDPEEKSGFSVHDRNSHENLLSFFKPGFRKKDIPGSPFHSRLNGKPASTDLSKLSYSNGMIYADDRKLNGVPNGRLVNGRAALDTGDLAHAHSSSNLLSGYGRCTSLQRNGGTIGGALAQRATLTDKPGYSTLQWARYSSTSLVPT
ncbi:ubiquitin carboxyl-terminal hydrolase 43-like [Periophthalmus magnuspinnatus]|uniref:ubiquitin carboxyl-terminal hydrolase 43-like n=1 Tax=Periophthalmus magnuspinnatus TaxID=409849 RepID=UPI002437012C|nr:ubiquitin carboxyl-terminal hydrolase 43-like [Periophthalmus magnuspinnatus]